MGDDGIFAINATILNTNPLWLVDINNDDTLQRFFFVIAKGEEEWHLKLRQEEVFEKALDGEPIARQILCSIQIITDFLSKDCGSDKMKARIYKDVWRLTWVW